MKVSIYEDRVNRSIGYSKEKMLKSKLESFKKFLKVGYNVETITFNDQQFEVMLKGTDSEDSLTTLDFGALYDYGIEIGSVFKADAFDSYWLVFEQNKMERTYFRGTAAEARYIINWMDPVNGVSYSTRACARAKVKTATSAEESLYHYKSQSDQIEITLPKKVDGIDFLIYGKNILVNDKKWEITGIEDTESEHLMYLKADVVPLDSQMDDLDNNIADGLKSTYVYELESNLDGVEELQVGEVIDFNYKLLLNGSEYKIIPSIVCFNCSYDEEEGITFNETGESTITVSYEELNKSFTYTITVADIISVSKEIFKIDGNSKLKTFLKYTFDFEHLLNGESQVVTGGTWSVDEEYFDIVNVTDDSIDLKVLSSTGSTTVKFTLDEVEYIKDVEIISIMR